jgi:hypothetical protein
MTKHKQLPRCQLLILRETMGTLADRTFGPEKWHELYTKQREGLPSDWLAAGRPRRYAYA